MVLAPARGKEQRPVNRIFRARNHRGHHVVFRTRALVSGLQAGQLSGRTRDARMRRIPGHFDFRRGPILGEKRTPVKADQFRLPGRYAIPAVAMLLFEGSWPKRKPPMPWQLELHLA